MKKYIMGVLYDRITNEEIDFLMKIKNVLNRKYSNGNEANDDND